MIKNIKIQILLLLLIFILIPVLIYSSITLSYILKLNSKVKKADDINDFEDLNNIQKTIINDFKDNYNDIKSLKSEWKKYKKSKKNLYKSKLILWSILIGLSGIIVYTLSILLDIDIIFNYIKKGNKLNNNYL